MIAGLVCLALVRSFGLESGSGMRPDSEVIILNNSWEKLPEDESGIFAAGYACMIPPDCEGRLILSMENYWSDIRVFIDGQELFAYEDPYREKGVVRHWIELPDNAAGKTIIICSEQDSPLFEQTVKGNSYLGTGEAVLYRFLNDNLYALVCGIFALILCVVLCVGGFYLKIRFTEGEFRGMVYLGLFILSAGCWIVSDSQLLQLFTDRTGLITLVSFLSFMIMPVFLIRFIKGLLIGSEKFLSVMEGLYLVHLAGSAVTSLLRVAPLYQTPWIEHILIVVTVIGVLRIGFREIRWYGNHEMKRVLQGFVLLSLFGIAALVQYYTNLSSGYAYLYSLGILSFMACLACAALQKVYYFLGKSARTEVYQKLAYVDLMTGLENRTAFIEMQKQESAAEKMAYIMFDINNLKTVNDQYGHREGDQLIIEAAECIRDVFERVGQCFRIGGDEFVVVWKGASKEEVAGALAQLDRRIRQANMKRSVDVEIAYGYAVRTGMSKTVQELYQEADSNMYKKKQEMKGKVQKQAFKAVGGVKDG